MDITLEENKVVGESIDTSLCYDSKEDCLYLIGGRCTSVGSCSSVFYKYSFRDHKWIVLPDLPEKLVRTCSNFVEIKGRKYILSFSGYFENWHFSAYYKDLFIFDIQEGKWKKSDLKNSMAADPCLVGMRSKIVKVRSRSSHSEQNQKKEYLCYIGLGLSYGLFRSSLYFLDFNVDNIELITEKLPDVERGYRMLANGCFVGEDAYYLIISPRPNSSSEIRSKLVMLDLNNLKWEEVELEKEKIPQGMEKNDLFCHRDRFLFSLRGEGGVILYYDLREKKFGEYQLVLQNLDDRSKKGFFERERTGRVIGNNELIIYGGLSGITASGEDVVYHKDLIRVRLQFFNNL